MSNTPIELLVMLGISQQESARNLKQQIKNLEKNNLPKLNLIAGLDAKLSTENIKKQISAIQNNLKDLDVTLEVKGEGSNNKVFEQMNRQIDSLQNKIQDLERQLKGFGSSSKHSSGNNPFSPTQEGAEKTLKSIMELEEHVRQSNGKIKIIDDKETGKVKEVVTTVKNQLGQLESKVYRPTIDIAVGGNGKGVQGLLESTQITDSSIFNNFNKQAEQAKNKLDELGRQGKLSGKSFKELKRDLDSATTTEHLDNLINKMKQVSQVDSHNNKWKNATNNIKTQANESIVVLEKLRQQASNLGLDTKQFDVMISKMHSMSNIQIVNDAQMNKANDTFSKLSSQVSALKNNTTTFDTTFKSFNNILDSATRSGLMNADSINKIRNSITALNSTNLTVDEKVRRLKDEISQLNAKLGETKHSNKMAEGMQKAKTEVDKLQAALTRVENSYTRTVDRNAVTSVQQEINRLSNVPLFTDTSQIKAYNRELQNVNARIKQIGADATTAGRNSMGIIESLKTALQKFPIWMLSSTLFFGVTRGIQDLIDKTVELDRQMTNLKRVMDIPDYKFNEVLEKSIVNVTNLSGKLEEYLELVNEFGRMGFNDIETLDLSNTAQMLTNISDLDAGESVSSLMAAMIAFNIEAENSVEIANKLNEVDNNFSVTTKDLAQSLNKSANVANVYGASLDQLLGYTTSIVAATRE